jgi:hypothetical protein
MKFNILYKVVPVAVISLIGLSTQYRSPTITAAKTKQEKLQSMKVESPIANLKANEAKKVLTASNVDVPEAIGTSQIASSKEVSREVASITEASAPAFKLELPSSKNNFSDEGSFHNKINGLAAVKALGNNIGVVAKLNNITAEELKKLLIMDHTAYVTSAGKVVFLEDIMPDLKPVATTYYAEADTNENALANGLETGIILTTGTIDVSAATSAYDSFSLHSRPTAKKRIYLDFKGHTFIGSRYNVCKSSNGATVCYDKIVAPAFSTDTSATTFSVTELNYIKTIWAKVAAAYAAFDVDVTTQEPTAAQMQKTSTTDTEYGVHVLITKSNAAFCGTMCGGVAYLLMEANFNNTYADKSNVAAFVFTDMLGNGNPKYTADAITHEVGHTFGLMHDGLVATSSTAAASYYQGHGSGDTGWAPIMGVGYYKNLVQWSKGEYPNANNKVDEIAKIATSVPLIADDAGNNGSVATAKDLPTLKTISGLFTAGTDIDVYKFTQKTSATVTIKATPDAFAPRLDIKMTLVNASGGIVATINPTANLYASLTMTLPAGTYYLKLESVSYGTLATGYSNYGGIGGYTVTMQ